jgi:S-DNA-T family DNA segregation ATPase FtsK/SpoIIIE
VDSRVILDQPGAERLLGRGDMLFQSPDAANPLRMQGVFVADSEIQRLVRYWKGARVDTAPPAAEAPAPIGSSTPPPSAAGATNLSSAPASTPVKPPRQTALWDEPGAGDVETPPEGDDDLLEEAIKAVREMKKASISMLQRRLRIGYTRAARLIDVLEEKGIIGPAESGAKPREVINFGAGAASEAPPEPGNAPAPAPASEPSAGKRTWTSE